jgi:hypothetical protein
MLTNFLIAFSTLLILLLMSGILAFYYFRSVNSALEDDWQIVLDNLHLRLDKIPNLIETVKMFAPGQEKAVSEIVRLREESWPMRKADRAKVHKELAVSERLRAFFDLPGKFPELGKDTNFLSLRTEFKQLNAAIEKSADVYNDGVRKYNKMVELIFFRPLTLVFHFSGKPVFEYEG